MKIEKTNRFTITFEVGDSKYSFNIFADSEEEAKSKIKADLQEVINQIA